MADSKITALTALTAADPVNDMFPVVDVSDTSMAASGTTKRISANNILSSSPTASGALTVTGLVTAGSANVTGDLTVDTSTLKVDSTNNRVGILTATPGAPLDIFTNNLADAILIRGNDNANVRIRMVNSGAGGEEFALSAGIPSASNSSFVIRSVTAASNRYVINQTGEHAWATNAGTAMTLNSTGLGVGDSPSYKLHVAKTTDGTLGFFRRISGTINPALTVYCNETGNTVGFGTDYAGATSPSITFTTGGSERVRIDGSSSKVSISASTATAADDRLVFSENMGSVNLGSQIVWNNSSFSTPYASIGVSNGAAGSNGTLIFSTCSSIFTNTNTERVRIKPTGQVRFFPLAADPAGAETGDVYYNSVSNKLKCYNGTIWNDLF
jgi:hypothetical protein